jgi:myo-inositol-1(or 4)-monophosphatase
MQYTHTSKRVAVASQAALKAGQTLLQYDPATVATAVKTTAGDLVTAADLASEKVITQAIHASFPDDLVISEETAQGHELLMPTNLTNLTAWVIDPIDGTNNFKKGMAYSGISIG